MVISHTYRYVFIEIPLTASWAIRHELCKYYEGEPILHKHATYPEFLQAASPQERNYFAFATVRHPLDEAVSRYFKLKTDHSSAFSDPAALEKLQIDESDLPKYRFIQETHADFEAYFSRFHRHPFIGMIDLSAPYLDAVIHYETLQADFADLLVGLGIRQVRPVPLVNKTAGRGADWQSYYTPAMVEQARRSIGPFMRWWGYRFPAEWGQCTLRQRDELAYRLLSVGQRQYVSRFRYSDSLPGKAARRLKAALVR